MINFVERNKELKKFMTEVSVVAGYLWDKGLAERNAGNITANVTSLITDSQYVSGSSEKEKLPSNFSGLAGMFFFVTATGKRMRDVAKDIYANSLIINISDDGDYYYKITKKDAKNLNPYIRAADTFQYS